MRDSKMDGDPERWTLLKYLGVAFAIGFAGYVPLELYIVFGPKDGNPVGLGVLFFLGAGIGALVLAVGVIRHLAAFLIRKR